MAALVAAASAAFCNFRLSLNSKPTSIAKAIKPKRMVMHRAVSTSICPRSSRLKIIATPCALFTAESHWKRKRVAVLPPHEICRNSGTCADEHLHPAGLAPGLPKILMAGRLLVDWGKGPESGLNIALWGIIAVLPGVTQTKCA